MPVFATKMSSTHERAGRFARSQSVDALVEHDPPAVEQDQTIERGLDFGQEVSREEDAAALIGSRAQQLAEEDAPSRRIQAQAGIVEQQQLRPVRQREHQGEAPGLAARQSRPLAAQDRARVASMSSTASDGSHDGKVAA